MSKSTIKLLLMGAAAGFISQVAYAAYMKRGNA
jgi:hypothetical protein